VEHLNRYLSGRLFEERRTRAAGALDGRDREGASRLVDFLRVHKLNGQPLMLNGSIDSPDALRAALRRAVELLGQAAGGDGGGDDWMAELRRLGFEPGWGGTAERARDTMELLLDIMEAPDPRHLAEFLARVPMITSIAILSPHGYFGQANVLGKPDTGGQVVYILDQVRALERAMRDSLVEQGIDIEPSIVVITRLIPEAGDTTCDQRIERILGTRNARILRVPFRTEEGEIVRPWISRFRIWPYLERFALDAERELRAEIGGRPDMVIGNYSDGNLVASIMSRRLGRDAVQHRPRAREDEVRQRRHPVEGTRGRPQFRLPVHGGPHRDEHRRFHHHEHVSGDRRDEGKRRTVRELPGVHAPRPLPGRFGHRLLRPEVQHRLTRSEPGGLLPV
jgi:sucrose synthase